MQETRGKHRARGEPGREQKVARGRGTGREGSPAGEAEGPSPPGPRASGPGALGGPGRKPNRRPGRRPGPRGVPGGKGAEEPGPPGPRASGLGARLGPGQQPMRHPREAKRRCVQRKRTCGQRDAKGPSADAGRGRPGDCGATEGGPPRGARRRNVHPKGPRGAQHRATGPRGLGGPGGPKPRGPAEGPG